jgi:hypothetical protein
MEQPPVIQQSASQSSTSQPASSSQSASLSFLFVRVIFVFCDAVQWTEMMSSLTTELHIPLHVTHAHQPAARQPPATRESAAAMRQPPVLQQSASQLFIEVIFLFSSFV